MSVEQDILEAAAAAIESALGILTRVRKRIHIGRDDATPFVMVTGIYPTIREIVGFADSSGNVPIKVRYRVGVVLVRTGNQLYENGRDLVPDMIQTTRRTLDAVALTNASTVYDADIEPWEIFDESMYQRNLDYSLLGVEFRSNENRNG